MRVFDELESNVRSYIRSFPAVFEKSKGCSLFDEQGKEYLDFFAGAGTLNYGHNNPLINDAIVEYIQKDGIIHGLDKATTAKKEFLERMRDVILAPRNMSYKIQFPGPTGTNAVETALKLARMVKGRSNVISFTNGYHGLTMGSVALTGNAFYRDEAFINRMNVSFMPFDGYMPGLDTLGLLRKMLEDNSSGVDLPSAIILETIQAEGGVNVASAEWLRGLEQICRDMDILLIVDDIQVGNGRTGQFFSFEEAGINPDIIILSKSIGGGLPLSVVLMKPELDHWKPGEHTGTFRGNNLAFVAAAKALTFWENDSLTEAVKQRSAFLKQGLEKIAGEFEELNIDVRGRGLIYGMEIPHAGFCGEVSSEAFERGLIIEVVGADDTVFKFLPPLIIDEEQLQKGLDILKESMQVVLDKRQATISGGLQ